MKILHVIAGLHTSNGMTSFVLDLCKGLAEAGISLGICTGVIAVSTAELPKECALSSNLAEMTDRLEGVDVVHVHGLWLRRPNTALRWAGRQRIPILLSVHGMLSPLALAHHAIRKRLAWALYQRANVHRATALHCTSGAEAEAVQALLPGKETLVIPPGMDTTPRLSREECDKRRLILYLGRISPEKNLPALLEAWAAVQDRRGFTLCIAGPGSAGTLSRIQRLCQVLGLTASRRLDDINPLDVIVCGEVDAHQKEYLFQRCRCLVLPSRTENFGLVVAESLARGIPVLATTGTPWRELEGCEDAGRSGWWVPPTPAALHEALQEMLHMSSTTLETFGMNGRKLIESRYSRAKMTQAFVQAYRRFLP